MKWSFESQDASGAYSVRSDLLAYLESYATDESDVDAAALIFGELVGNVVRHAPGPIAVDLHWEDGLAVLRVRDRGPGFEWVGHTMLPELFAENGRGLYIVASVARSMRINRLPDRGTEAVVGLPVSLRPTHSQQGLPQA
jgi:anti-sigma regulatory factor (Ser/Thr protein kinase)